MRNFTILLTTTAMLVALTTSCSDDEPAVTDGDLNLSISGLTDLGTSFNYEGWLIVNGAPVSSGIFTVDGSGNLSQSSFTMGLADLEGATTFVLTIEPIPDADAGPSNTKILGGDFSGNNASLSIMHPAAFGTGFAGVSGGYILATPTTTTADDDLSGVWFLDNSSGMAAEGLSELPDLSGLSGWEYEGWAVIDGEPVSTGRFNTASGVDDNDMFSGSDNSGPPFPGEDFIVNAPGSLVFPTNLQGQTMVISIEPIPDNSPDPFVLKPLAGTVPSDLQPATFTEMDNIAASTYPSGTVSK